MFAHVDVQVLLGAELVRELFRAEALSELSLLSLVSRADLHLLVIHHAGST